ncbi:SRPBCC family protein [Pseudonocardia humida]|uniref:SRPBCC family protein n=1 Tax=Pseudonocardia humida TaxID=2800819 RepID=A0ABT1ABJ2_9PSEU|nr:SRPBCC family protein [Pseudonocardia humida]MCO1660373.1 SRPBCC family protein [Pseudonocardia humida]
MFESRHLSISIARPWREVYDFAVAPANLPQWAAGLAGSTVELIDGDWVTDSPMGRVKVAFAEANEFGVLDHDVTLPTGEVVTNPVRVFANGDGCDVVFSVRRRDGMSEADLDRDAGVVQEDLRTLRALMEA